VVKYDIVFTAQGGRNMPNGDSSKTVFNDSMITEIESLYKDFIDEISFLYKKNPEKITIHFLEQQFFIFKAKRDNLLIQELNKSIKK
jgi:hypothetical protein